MNFWFFFYSIKLSHRNRLKFWIICQSNLCSRSWSTCRSSDCRNKSIFSSYSWNKSSWFLRCIYYCVWICKFWSSRKKCHTYGYLKIKPSLLPPCQVVFILLLLFSYTLLLSEERLYLKRNSEVTHVALIFIYLALKSIESICISLSFAMTLDESYIYKFCEIVSEGTIWRTEKFSYFWSCKSIMLTQKYYDGLSRLG